MLSVRKLLGAVRRPSGGRRRPMHWGWVGITLAVAAPAPGVVFFGTGDLNFNTTAPTGALAGSGWQWVGVWGGFQGTAIGPHHFLAARHVGGAVGDPFVLNGANYTTVAFTDDAVSDLRVWEVREPFPSWAPLYRNSDEVGRGLVAMGRGLTRGTEVRVNTVLKGWMWGSFDGRLRWGQNTVAANVDGGSYWGGLLYATFDATGGPNEADLASGDSSGAVFVDDGAGWKLAGVAATVDGYFNTTPSGDGFIACLFDCRGLYLSATPPTGWTLVVGSQPVPTGFYASRVSIRASWIDAVTTPSSDAPALPTPLLGALAVAFAASGVRTVHRLAQRSSKT